MMPMRRMESLYTQEVLKLEVEYPVALYNSLASWSDKDSGSFEVDNNQQRIKEIQRF